MAEEKALSLGGPLKRAGGYLGRMAVDVAKNKLPALARAAWPVLTDIVPEALGAILAPEIILPAVAVAAAGYGAYKLYNYLKKTLQRRWLYYGCRRRYPGRVISKRQ